ncbi:MAG: hypothetical protein U0791_23175 [Gemmataceae bacterium]
MAVQRKSIKLFEHDRELLVKLYLRWRIPVDQFESRAEDQRVFLAEWHKLTSRGDTFAELLHYMRTQRKRGLWVTLDGNHKAPLAVPNLTSEETMTLVSIFRDNVSVLESGSDNLAYDDEISALIAKEFAASTGRIVPATDLIAKLTALRKRGLLPKAIKCVPDADSGFDDIDQVETA